MWEGNRVKKKKTKTKNPTDKNPEGLQGDQDTGTQEGQSFSHP